MSRAHELEPCPFCGGVAEFERRGTPRQSCIVACGNCGARHESSDENERSGESWNRRAAPEAQPVAQSPFAHLYRDHTGQIKLAQTYPPPAGSFPVFLHPAPPQPAYAPLSLDEGSSCAIVGSMQAVFDAAPARPAYVPLTAAEIDALNDPPVRPLRSRSAQCNRTRTKRRG